MSMSKKPRKKSKSQDRVLTYPPPFLGSLLTLLTMNATEAGAGFGDFAQQLKSNVEFAKKLEQERVPGSDSVRGAVMAIESFYTKDETRKRLVDDAHKAIAAMLTQLADDGEWGGCKHVSQTRIKQIIQLP